MDHGVWNQAWFDWKRILFLRGVGKEEDFLLEGFKYRIGCCERLKITYHMD